MTRSWLRSSSITLSRSCWLAKSASQSSPALVGLCYNTPPTLALFIMNLAPPETTVYLFPLDWAFLLWSFSALTCSTVSLNSYSSSVLLETSLWYWTLAPFSILRSCSSIFFSFSITLSYLWIFSSSVSVFYFGKYTNGALTNEPGPGTPAFWDLVLPLVSICFLLLSSW